LLVLLLLLLLLLRSTYTSCCCYIVVVAAVVVVVVVVGVVVVAAGAVLLLLWPGIAEAEAEAAEPRPITSRVLCCVLVLCLYHPGYPATRRSGHHPSPPHTSCLPPPLKMRCL
jgi:hypothetical protein